MIDIMRSQCSGRIANETKKNYTRNGDTFLRTSPQNDSLNIMSYEMPKRNETKLNIYQIDYLYFVDVVEQVFLKVHSEV